MIAQSGSAGLGFAKGNLRSRFPAPFIPSKVADPRSPLLALLCATTMGSSSLTSISRMSRDGARQPAAQQS